MKGIGTLRISECDGGTSPASRANLIALVLEAMTLYRREGEGDISFSSLLPDVFYDPRTTCTVDVTLGEALDEIDKIDKAEGRAS